MTWFVAQPHERWEGLVGTWSLVQVLVYPLHPIAWESLVSHCLGTPCAPFPAATRGSLASAFL